MKIQVLRIPLPPSVNNLFFTTKKGGRAKKPEYEGWIAETMIRASIDLVAVTGYPVAVRIDVMGGKDFNVRSDIANLEKAATDTIVKVGILKGDHVLCINDNRQVYNSMPGLVHSYATYTIFEPEESDAVAA